MQFEAIQLFASTPGGPELYAALEAALTACFPEIEIRPKRTQIGFFHGCGFAWAWPARRKGDREAERIGFSIGLPYRAESPRIASAVEAGPGRWTNHLLLSGPEEIDAELLNWIAEAHSFAAFRSRR